MSEVLRVAIVVLGFWYLPHFVVGVTKNGDPENYQDWDYDEIFRKLRIVSVVVGALILVFGR